MIETKTVYAMVTHKGEVIRHGDLMRTKVVSTWIERDANLILLSREDNSNVVDVHKDRYGSLTTVTAEQAERLILLHVEGRRLIASSSHPCLGGDGQQGLETHHG